MFDEAVVLVAFAYVIFQCAALYAFSGRWLTAATAPAVGMALALVAVIVGLFFPTSDAVLPLVLGLPAATLYLAALWFLWGLASLRRTA
jgi:hypothetical protein